MSGLLLRNVELPGGRFDIRCTGGVVAEVGHDLVPAVGETVLVGATSVLPGLHDHHLHLIAMAARSGSVELGDDGPVSDADLRSLLRRADARTTGDRWIRAVGYDGERGASPDRRVLDDAIPHRPVRVQHRSGHLWILNSAACRAVGLDRMDGTDRIERDAGIDGIDGIEGIEGIERDGDGIPTGRLFDLDDWLASRLPRDAPPELGAVSRRLAGFGVTGVTDATPSRRAADLSALALGRSSGAVVQRVVVMGGSELSSGDAPDGLELGPVKVMVSDEHPPGIDDLADAFATAHGRGRALAVHCVTRLSAVLALAAWERSGTHPGDRMEHGAVLPPDSVAALARLGVGVVTQPSFIASRGDRYRAEVDACDLPHLYRCRSLEAAGVAVGGSTDAPFGPEDPWAAMRAAVTRRTRAGAGLGLDERVSGRRALDLFLTHPHRPGGAPRTVIPGARADLCLLDCSLDEAATDLDHGHVVATVVAGGLAHER